MTRLRSPVAILFAIAVLTLSACAPTPRPPADSATPALDSVGGSARGPVSTRIPMPPVDELFRLTGGLTRTAYLAVAPDSTVTLKIKVYGIRGFRPIDTLEYTYRRNDSLQLTRKSTSSIDSARVGAPADGATARYLACAQILIGGTTRRAPPTPACWSSQWVYTRPAGDATLDSVAQLAIRGRALVPGGPWAAKAGHATSDSQQVQFCAFVVMKDGRKVTTSTSASVPICKEELQRWLAERPS